MKNEVGIVLRPTISSTLRTPIASDGYPLKSLSITLVLIRSAEERPNRRSTEYGIRLTAAPVSTNILFTGLPLMKPLRYNPAARWPIPPVGVPRTPMGAQTPCSHQPMASHRLLSAWGATPFLEGASPPFASARSGRAFLSTSRYFASASSRLRKRCTLRFYERLSPSGHHRGRWYLSSSSGTESPLDGRLT